MAVDLYELAVRFKSEGFKTVSRDMDGLDKKGKALGKAFTALKASLVVGAVGGFLRKVVKETGDAQRETAQLNAVLKSTGQIAGVTSSDINKLAASLQSNSTFSDGAVKSAAALLLTFTNIRGEVFKNTLPAITDLATAMGTDLQTATIQVGKALNDPIRGVTALQRVGIQFSQSQRDVIKNLVETNRLAEAQGIILKELQVQFGGSALAARNTLGGALTHLGNKWDEVFEASTKSSAGIVGAINRIADALPRMRAAVDDAFSKVSLRMRAVQIDSQIAAMAIHAVLNPKGAMSALGHIGALRVELQGIEKEYRRITGVFSDVTSGASTGTVRPPAPLSSGGGGRTGGGRSAAAPGSLIPDFDFGRNIGSDVMARIDAIGSGDIDILGPLRKRLEESPEEIARLITDLKTTIEQGPIAQFREDMGQTISQSFASTLGDAIYNGLAAAFNGEGLSGIIGAFGKTILAGVGQIFTQLGQTYLSYGILMKSLAALLPNPFTAGLAGIAIGTALIAMGSALGAVASGGGGVGRGTAQAGAFRERNNDIVRLKFTDRPGYANSLSPMQPIVINAYGPNDPKTQRWMMESLAKATRR